MENVFDWITIHLARGIQTSTYQFGDVDQMAMSTKLEDMNHIINFAVE